MFNNPTAQAHRALAQKTSDRKGSVSSTWCLSRCCERFGILVGRAHKGVGLPHRSQGGAQALEPPRGEVGLRWAPSGWLSTSTSPVAEYLRHCTHACNCHIRLGRRPSLSIAIFGPQLSVWCRDSTGWFLPVMSQNATCCHCFLV